MHDRVGVPLAGRLSDLRRVAPAIDVQSRGDSGAAMSNFLPYFQIIRSGLYAGRDLFAGFDVNAPASFGLTPEFLIYRQFVAGGGAISGGYLSTMMQSLHDNSIAQALRVWLANEKCSAPPGGHDLARTDPAYTQIAQRARPLASLKVAMRAPELIAKPAASVAVPAGRFGHGPGTPLATQIARYFENSVREDGLVSIGTYGVMFAAGTAGTIQEIFQNTTNNLLPRVRRVHRQHRPGARPHFQFVHRRDGCPDSGVAVAGSEEKVGELRLWCKSGSGEACPLTTN